MSLQDELSTIKLDGEDKSEIKLVWNEPDPVKEGVRSWMKKKWLRNGFVVLLIVIVGFIYLRKRPGEKVTVVSPSKRDVVELVIATGRIQSKETSTIGAEIAGIVSEVYVEEGARVKRGQKLARLVQSEMAHRIRAGRLSIRTAQRLLAQVRQKPLAPDIAAARANVALAVSRYKQMTQELSRGRRLFRGKSISRAELDKLISGTEQAKASMHGAQANHQKLLSIPRRADVDVVEARVLEAKAGLQLLLNQASKRLIKAPFAGIIASRKLSVGQVVAPGSPLFVLASTERTEVFAETDENNLPKLRVGQQAIIVASAYKDRSFKAVLEQIGPIVDNQRGVVGLRLRPLQLPPFVLLNMTVDINVEVASWKQALSLPSDTLVKRDGKNYVMVLRQGKSQLMPVQLRGQNTDWIVLSGIKMTERVIRRAHPMKAGRKVRVFRTKPSQRRP